MMEPQISQIFYSIQLFCYTAFVYKRYIVYVSMFFSLTLKILPEVLPPDG